MKVTIAFVYDSWTHRLMGSSGTDWLLLRPQRANHYWRPFPSCACDSDQWLQIKIDRGMEDQEEQVRRETIA